MSLNPFKCLLVPISPMELQQTPGGEFFHKPH